MLFYFFENKIQKHHKQSKENKNIPLSNAEFFYQRKICDKEPSELERKRTWGEIYKVHLSPVVQPFLVANQFMNI